MGLTSKRPQFVKTSAIGWAAVVEFQGRLIGLANHGMQLTWLIGCPNPTWQARWLAFGRRGLAHPPRS